MIKKTLIMGILNITPDSFSDGGKYFSSEDAISHANNLIKNGADIIDIGAESTRPNFKKISADEEISRLQKILSEIKKFSVPISIDTYKPEVAEFALNFGAKIINDISGLADKKMLEVAKKFNAQVIAMHNRKFSGKVIDDIKKFFTDVKKICEIHNFDTSQIIFDPGIGFNKTQEENLIILKNLRELRNFTENKILLGASRKSFMKEFGNFEIDDRDEATGAICVLAISQGIDIVRVHNVKMISKMCKMADILTR